MSKSSKEKYGDFNRKALVEIVDKKLETEMIIAKLTKKPTNYTVGFNAVSTLIHDYGVTKTAAVKLVIGRMRKLGVKINPGDERSLLDATSWM